MLLVRLVYLIKDVFQEKVHDCLIKTKNIVTELMATLNMDKGGDIAKNLQSLYSYMFSQLIEANMNKKTDIRNLNSENLKSLNDLTF